MLDKQCVCPKKDKEQPLRGGGGGDGGWVQRKEGRKEGRKSTLLKGRVECPGYGQDSVDRELPLCVFVIESQRINEGLGMELHPRSKPDLCWAVGVFHNGF